MNLSSMISNAALMPRPITTEGFSINRRSGFSSPEAIRADLELQRMLLIYAANKAQRVPSYAMRNGQRVIVWEVRFPKGSRYKNGPLSISPSEAMAGNYYRNNCFSGISINEAQGDRNAVGKELRGAR